MSSVTPLWAANVSGGAGSEEETGMGSGTPRIAYSRSGVESRSIGNIAESVVSRVVRVGVKRDFRDENRILLAIVVRNYLL